MPFRMFRFLVFGVLWSLSTLQAAFPICICTALNPSQPQPQPQHQSAREEVGRRPFLQQIVLFGTGVATVTKATVAQANAAQPTPSSSDASPPVTIAKDRYGSDLLAKPYVKSKAPRDRSLVMGLKGEPTYLIVNNESQLENYALNAECSHLGCIVPWNEFENKFVCPCHGSQYDKEGNVLRGPAPYPLALAHVTIDEDNDKIGLTPWTEVDFRTNEKPWWK